jgi:hypothetical protein
MKKYIIKFLLISVALGSTLSCSKKIDEAYLNPNSDVRVPPETLLPQIVAAMAANYAGHGQMNDIRYFGQYIQNWQYYVTLSQFDRMGYINSAADVSQSIWRAHYYDIGQNNMKMIEWAMDEKKWDYAGVGKAIFAWSWLTLTDVYGEVILKEAFNTDLITFHYDKQEEVYAYVRQLCHESLALLSKTGDNASQANLAKGDAFFYNGDVNKWKKFVYGILARSFHHLTNKSSYRADSVIKYCDLSINSNVDNAMVKFAANPSVSATNNFFGPLRANLGVTTTPAAIRQGEYIANLMNGTNTVWPGVEDPRAIYMLRQNKLGTFKGIKPNKGQAAIDTNNRPENFWGIPQIVASNTAPANDNNCRYIFRNSAPFPILTAAEVKFMKAEAQFRSGAPGAALTSYTEGIDANFDMLETQFPQNVPAALVITPATKANYKAAVIPATSAGLTLSKIMLQKYIALFGHGVLETWVDMRRYHYTDADPMGPGQVYADFTPPQPPTDLFPDNAGKLVYRYYKRFNSEYVWNRAELERNGETVADYHTREQWFSKP